MKTTILAATLTLGVAVALTSHSAEAAASDAPQISYASFAETGEQTAALLHKVKGAKRGHRGGHRNGRSRDRNNRASDGFRDLDRFSGQRRFGSHRGFHHRGFRNRGFAHHGHGTKKFVKRKSSGFFGLFFNHRH